MKTKAYAKINWDLYIGGKRPDGFHAIDTVMVNGRIVVEGGELVGVDVPALVERADRIADGLRSRARD